MLYITVPEQPKDELWDETNKIFIQLPACPEAHLQLEHSLVSLAKWEAIWHVHFIENKDLTDEQIKSYIKCMTITQNVPDSVYERLTAQNIQDIKDYIADPHTATKCYATKKGSPQKKRIITSELLYCYMIMCGIPVEFQKWHLNRLTTLIEVCQIEMQPEDKKKKMTQEDIDARNAENERRRRELQSKG